MQVLTRRGSASIEPMFTSSEVANGHLVDAVANGCLTGQLQLVGLRDTTVGRVVGSSTVYNSAVTRAVTGE